jgi:hypothetical protein
MNRSAVLFGATAVLSVVAAMPAMARPHYLGTFKSHYKTTDSKPTLNAANCGMCHMGAPRDAKYTSYGEAVKMALGGPNVQDTPKIVAALQAVEKKQNPTTKVTFARMIQADLLPGSDKAPSDGTPLAWEELFDGRSYAGMTKENEGNYVVTPEGNLRYTGGGRGWLRTNKTYTNYALVLVWRFVDPSNTTNDAGLYVKARPGDRGNPFPKSPQLSMGPGNNFGNLLGRPGRGDLMKANDWNTYQLTVQDGMASLSINNQIAWEGFADDALKGEGHVGLQVENFPFEIRRLYILPLP